MKMFLCEVGKTLYSFIMIKHFFLFPKGYTCMCLDAHWKRLETLQMSTQGRSHDPIIDTHIKGKQLKRTLSPPLHLFSNWGLL